MHEDLLVSLALIPALGIAAQWISWRLRQPSIIFLLSFGLLVGPIATLILGDPIIDVTHVFGELLFPFVSLAVSIILFEGGLGLRFSDIRGSGRVVRRLISLGVVATWLISAVAAYYLFDFDVGLSLLMGATIVVTGPTVIIPLLKQIRPKGRVGSILRWEGIIIDPVGAVLAVLVFEEIIGGPDIPGLVWSITKSIMIGVGLGVIAGRLMLETYRRFLVPDSLQNPVTLSFVISAFTISNVLQPESGLLTVTVMGIVMANQNRVDIRHIIEFKETLQVLLLSTLFIILAARITPADLEQIGWPVLIFVAIIIFVERPLAVYLSTIGSGLNWRERLFLAWMAPRGIVAASVASIFALELQERGVEDAAKIVPFTFAVIIATVATYALTSGPLARRLGLAEQNPQGLLIVGSSRWIRDMAREVQALGFRVLLTETNQARATRAMQEKLDVYYGNVLSERSDEEINLLGIGRVLAMTSNAEVNALVGERFRGEFDTDSVFQLPRAADAEDNAGLSRHLGGRFLFSPDATYDEISHRFGMGARVMQFTVGEPQAMLDAVPQLMLPLFLVPEKERLVIWVYDDPPRPQRGQTIIALVNDNAYEVLVQRGAIKLDGSRVTVSPGIVENGQQQPYVSVDEPPQPVTEPTSEDSRPQ